LFVVFVQKNKNGPTRLEFEQQLMQSSKIQQAAAAGNLGFRDVQNKTKTKKQNKTKKQHNTKKQQNKPQQHKHKQQQNKLRQKTINKQQTTYIYIYIYIYIWVPTWIDAQLEKAAKSSFQGSLYLSGESLGVHHFFEEFQKWPMPHGLDYIVVFLWILAVLLSLASWMLPQAEKNPEMHCAAR
jgi:L-lactate permease